MTQRSKLRNNVIKSIPPLMIGNNQGNLPWTSAPKQSIDARIPELSI
jgi:hypothetical protein